MARPDFVYSKLENPNFFKTFQENTGPDIAELYIDEDCFSGYFNYSPIESRLVSQYNYIPVADQALKPYRANWLIVDSHLILRYVDAVINDVTLYTMDIVEEYDEILTCFYTRFTGFIELHIQFKRAINSKNEFLGDHCKTLLLWFEKGFLVKTEIKKKI